MVENLVIDLIYIAPAKVFQMMELTIFSICQLKGLYIIDRIIQDDLGRIDLEKNLWYIPKFSINISKGSVD